MVRSLRKNNSDGTGSNVDVTQIIAGSMVFLILIVMCLVIAYLTLRRKRRIARETEEDRVRAREEAISRLIRRKKEAEEIVLTMTLDSDEAGSGNSGSEDSRRRLTQTSSSSSLSSTRNIVAEGISKIGTECSICFQEFEDGNLVAFSHNPHCTHFFHKECIVDWLARDDRCPTCRRDYLKNDDEETEYEDANMTASDRTDIEENPSARVQVLPQSQDPRSDMVENENSSTLASNSIHDNQLVEDVENPNENETDRISIAESHLPTTEDSDGNVAARFPVSTPNVNSFDEETQFFVQGINEKDDADLIQINVG
mmetsp:Transcript_13586/g.20627  ORF Transcript_13586/g.20627 Transcript_13586/m.20627 type:complete len:313 (+) Transcript_13586:110-1048(+)|eukprot:CAMPEP_0203669010 /NCGR_PEP_ID=MMETSP0090-20130426/5486_1 /ASSEMBLY_ACC=CAM_ASM_001088 /TAXON_ID=426623 /ORGANISM="Chaetoceros affinis, Strain CCMP159" /LENGTH=312 /DNA_ID=CAMNT_0050533583 /DNA_START=34 /DNA_END=972 /DNA_ORIENTATION=+